mmetsp:Transcript_16789/g.18688  ORF Transcript_16789/g.18688 Transcript_16789/m.18688 type:complete len:91 (+) Transcript_16789:226-498(+)
MGAFAKRMGKSPGNKLEYNNVNFDQNNSNESTNFIISFKPTKNRPSVEANQRVATFHGDNMLASKDISGSQTNTEMKISDFYDNPAGENM